MIAKTLKVTNNATGKNFTCYTESKREKTASAATATAIKWNLKLSNNYFLEINQFEFDPV